MADRILTADIIAQAALAVLENELGVLGTLYRAPEAEFSNRVNGYKVGETISIRRPFDPTVRTGRVAQVQDSVEGKVALTVNNQTGVDFDFTSADMTLSVESITERFIRPSVINIVEDMAKNVFLDFAKSCYHWVGTPGQVVNSFDDFSKGPNRLDDSSTPQGDRHACLATSDYWGMLGSNVGLFVQDAARTALRQANLGTIGGVDTWMSQVTPSHTVGALGGTPLIDGANQNVLYDAVKDTWAQTLNTKGWSASTQVLNRGDVFTIAGVNMVNAKTRADTGIPAQFVVNADGTSDGTGNLALNISPPIIVPAAGSAGQHATVTAAPADNAAITVVGTAATEYRQSLVYHKNAMALAVVPMEEPPGAVQVSRQSRNGISVRVIPDYDVTNDVSIFRLDLLYGYKLIDPRIATRLSGTA